MLIPITRAAIFRPKSVQVRTSAFKGRLFGMNDLATPCGPWQKGYDKLNAKNNILLATGLLTFLASCLYAHYQKEYHYYPPKFPCEHQGRHLTADF